MNTTAHKPLLVVELNEVNFDLVRRYLSTNELPAFRRLLTEFDSIETFAESQYDQLEPWIQWVSAHSGKTFGEHGIFRLGDGAVSNIPQIYEALEGAGLSVGAISPMNSRNSLARPAYFVPDPWTQTPSDSSGFSRRLTAMLRQTVNENAQGKISWRSLLTLAEVVLRTFNLRGTKQLVKLIGKAKGCHWYKALVLDQLIHLVHLHSLQAARPDVSFVFFNAGAHIQHHYYFNSTQIQTASKNPAWYVSASADPILDMIKAYDHALEDYLALVDQGARLLLATGLTQVPYNRVKFYYRLRNHAEFLGRLGIRFIAVQPRMTRDFEILFASNEEATAAADSLSALKLSRDGVQLFNEIDNRGKSLFVTLTYPNEIIPGDKAVSPEVEVADLDKQFTFVAIKNGMHDTKGFAFASKGSLKSIPRSAVHVSALYDLTMQAANRSL